MFLGRRSEGGSFYSAGGALSDRVSFKELLSARSCRATARRSDTRFRGAVVRR